MRCPTHEELSRAFAGSAPPSAELDAHLASCDGCRKSWNALEQMAAQIGGALDDFVDPALQEAIVARTRVSSQAPSPRPVPFWRLPWLAGGLALAGAAAAVAFVVLPARPPSPVTAGMQARGGSAIATDRWVGLTLYRTGRDSPGYERVAGSMRSSDALLFAYLNRPESGMHYLAALGVDARGTLYWYHPAHAEADGGAMLPITTGAAPVELREAITEPLHPGWLRIYGVFSAEPLTAATLETAVHEALAREPDVTRLGRLPIDATGQHTFLIRVEP